jgi:sulfite reductase (ferredoxin)
MRFLREGQTLNKVEKVKLERHPLEVRQAIIDTYSKDLASMSEVPGEVERLKWVGIYPQKQGGDAFMMRIKVPGGILTPPQARVIGRIAKDFANGPFPNPHFGNNFLDLTTRQDVQMHWIKMGDVPEIWRRLEEVGLDTTEACGDTPRVILGCPLAGVAAEEVLDGTPALRAVRDRYIGDAAFSNLPRKYKTSISGCARSCTNHEINDVSFVGVTGPDGTPGFDLWVGGGLSTNPKFAQRLGAFVEPDRTAEVWAGVTGLFRDHGYRRSRQHARLKFLLADWGTEHFREVLEKDFLDAPLPDGPAAVPHPGPRGHAGVTEQVDSRYAVGFALRAGRTSGTQLNRVAELAERYGSGRVRTTAQQQLVILDVPGDRVDELVAELAADDLPVRPGPFRDGTIACTGIEFCKLAIVETKQRAQDLYAELERRLPDFPEAVTVNVNGCPNSCARFQVADIGLKGSVARGADGEDVEIFQVHLGGHLGGDASLGRKFRGLKVEADGAADYVERVLRGYLDRREPAETFAAYAVRADEAWLR